MMNNQIEIFMATDDAINTLGEKIIWNLFQK